jgi:2-haloacid dehalogenase
MLDVHAAIRRRGASLGSRADPISQTWRTKQLEYAWVRSLSGRHADFWTCTTDALTYALQFHGADLALREDLLEAYRVLDPFADAAPALDRLREARVPALALSNGSPSMLASALQSAGVIRLLDACISIESAGVFKPAPAAYRLVVDHLGLDAKEIGFVSSNAWDVMGARAFGFAPVWVNRTGAPHEYGLGGTVQEVSSLADAAAYLVDVPIACSVQDAP